ncbi:hypothetical protein BH11ACT4_BH11ACT4_02180 [soil metagenome]
MASDQSGMEAASRGPIFILVATAIGGGSGYLLTVLAGATLGPAAYAPFAVFWSSLYLVIAGLAGIQQEVSRAARPVTGSPGRPVARNFALAAAFTIAVVAAGTAPLWSNLVFPSGGWLLALPLAFGVASYVLAAVLFGVLFGLRLWPLIAAAIAVDGVLRLLFTGIALALTKDLVILGWAITIPFLLTPALLWLFMRRRLIGKAELDVGYGRLLWNVARTLIGSTATGVLISGFPVLLGATSPGVDPARLAAVVLAINLARAPLVIVVLSLQSYFIVMFKRSLRPGAVLFTLQVVVAVAAVVVAAIAGFWGPALLRLVFGDGYRLDGLVLAITVVSGGLVGMLCVAGAALLAGGRHGPYSAGWVTAAVATIVILLLPLPLESRAVLALCIGPAVGLLVHLAAWAWSRPWSRPPPSVPTVTLR